MTREDCLRTIGIARSLIRDVYRPEQIVPMYTMERLEQMSDLLEWMPELVLEELLLEAAARKRQMRTAQVGGPRPCLMGRR